METIGIAAGLVTLITYIPQSIKTLRTRKVEDLSLATYILLVLSAGLWFTYGVGNRLPSIWATNLVVFLLSLSILVIKAKQVTKKRV